MRGRNQTCASLTSLDVKRSEKRSSHGDLEPLGAHARTHLRNRLRATPPSGVHAVTCFQFLRSLLVVLLVLILLLRLRLGPHPAHEVERPDPALLGLVRVGVRGRGRGRVGVGVRARVGVRVGVRVRRGSTGLAGAAVG